jgi:hypothetical protein
MDALTEGRRQHEGNEMTPWFSAFAAVVIAYEFIVRLVPIGGDDLFFLLNAEREYQRAAAILPDPANEMALAVVYRRQSRTEEEITALRIVR